MPAYLIIRDFPIGLSVPYMLASDGVSSFLILVEPELWLGNEFYEKVSFSLFGRTQFVVGDEYCRKAL